MKKRTIAAFKLRCSLLNAKMILWAVLLFSAANVHGQTGYIYVHTKALSEDINQPFSFTVSGGTTVVPNFTLQDQAINIEPTDIGSGHGTGGGELWAVAGASRFANGAIYNRSANSSKWKLVTGLTSASIDGADKGHFVSVNAAGDAFVYDGFNFIKILDHTALGIQAVDIANNGAIAPGIGYTAVVDQAGHVWKYTGNYSTSFTWADITPVNIGGKFMRLDINPANNNIILMDVSSYVTRCNSNGASPIYYLRGGGNSTLLGDVSIDDFGVIYSISRDAAGMDAVYRHDGLVWKEEGQTGLHYVLTCGAASQVWVIRGYTAAQQSTFVIPSVIFTRTGDGSATWIDDERIQTVQNDNAILIPVAAGSYTITQANIAGWNLQKINVFDSAAGSVTNVAGNSVTLVVSAGQVAHVVFINGIVMPTVMPAGDGAVNSIQNFGSGAANTRGGPVTGFTDFHYYNDPSKNTTPDGYYSLTQNSSQWGASITDHTGLPGGYFMMVNASYTPNAFYRQRITGLVPGKTYILSFYAANLSPGSPLQPSILAGVTDTSTGIIIGSVSTGSLAKDNGWHQYIFTFLATVTTGDIFLQNNALGGFGNDLAIDDISVSSIAGLLPVNMLSFDAQKQQQSVMVKWVVAAQENAAYFEVERSIDAVHWGAIAKVAVINEDAAVKNYGYIDADPINGTSYYRLKTVDADGTKNFTGNRMVQFSDMSVSIGIYPNPFASFIKVQVTAPKNTQALLRLLNAGGQVILLKNVQLVTGQNNITVDGLAALANGLYYLELKYDGKTIVEKIMKE